MTMFHEEDWEIILSMILVVGNNCSRNFLYRTFLFKILFN